MRKLRCRGIIIFARQTLYQIATLVKGSGFVKGSGPRLGDHGDNNDKKQQQQKEVVEIGE